MQTERTRTSIAGLKPGSVVAAFETGNPEKVRIVRVDIPTYIHGTPVAFGVANDGNQVLLNEHDLIQLSLPGYESEIFASTVGSDSGKDTK